MTKLIAIEPPFDFALTLRRFQANGADAANWFDGQTFRKAFQAQGRLYLLSLRACAGGSLLAVWPYSRAAQVWQTAENIANKILGLSFPLPDFYRFCRNDAVLKNLTARFSGLRPTLCADLFEMMITSITAQQINLRFAFAVRSRLVRRYGEKLIMNGATYYAFPMAEKLARVRVPSLRALQFTGKKSEYIIELARTIRAGKIDLAALPKQSDQEIAAQLLPLHGIGRWTVDWLLARGLGRGDAIAAGDLGVRKAIQHFYFNDKEKKEEEIRRFARHWGEFTNLAVHYLVTGLALGA